MNFLFNEETPKEIVFKNIKNYIEETGFKIIKTDETRPWGGFLVIDEIQSKNFIDTFFPSSAQDILIQNKLSPKILIVSPGKRLSWQYHFRRSEIWKIIGGEAGVAISNTDEETAALTYKINSVIQLKQGDRHRLIGLDSWGIVAEIWQHTDNKNPSNEEDIIRLQDDYGR
jgi:mannose-6-phosphate isomerase-like protein (cupin superfamily)